MKKVLISISGEAQEFTEDVTVTASLSVVAGALAVHLAAGELDGETDEFDIDDMDEVEYIEGNLIGIITEVKLKGVIEC